MTRQPGRPTAGRRLSPRIERERQINRFLLIGGIALVVLVVAIPGIAFYQDIFARGLSKAITINGTSYSMNEFVDRLIFRQKLLEAQFANVSDPQLQQFLVQQRSALPLQVKNEMIEAVLVQQEAGKRGLTVDNEAVDEEIQSQFGGATRNTIPQPNPVASPSPEVPATATPAPDPAQIRQRYDEFLRRMGLPDDQFRTLIRNDLLREKLADVLKTEVPPTVEHVRIRAIVLPAENEAKQVLEQVQGGADFASLAAEKSTDLKTKEQGGQYDWIARGTRDPGFDEKVFAAPPGLIPEVVNGLGGYAVIEVQEKDPARAPSADDRETLERQAFTHWLEEAKKQAQIEDNLTPDNQLWALRRAERQIKFGGSP